MKASRVLVVLLALAGCRDLSLSAPPGPPRPGSISGRTVTALPGRPGTSPLPGAQVELLGTGLATESDSDGFFRIDGLSSEVGQVLLRADLNGDGSPDRQKLLSLEALKAGPNKEVSLGSVVLSENAAVRGQVLLGDVGASSGHAGTLVFVPVGPYTTTTSDDGSFALSELPDSRLSGESLHDAGQLLLHLGRERLHLSVHRRRHRLHRIDDVHDDRLVII